MASVAIRKAALLLMSLDPKTAGELLKAAPEEIITEIAAELASLDLTGGGQGDEAGESAETVREFFSMVNQEVSEFHGSYSLNTLLEIAMGREKSQETLKEIEKMNRSRDPFLEIRTADVEDIAMALQGELPQVAAIVLSELRSQAAQEILPLLDDQVRAEAVRAMTSKDTVSPQARLHVAKVICNRVRDMRWKERDDAALGKRKEEMRMKQLRRIAVILQGLSSELCENLLKQLAEADPETIKTLRNLMVIWEDVPRVHDRCLQEVLRAVESQMLALALYEADPRIIRKIRSNISERAARTIDEELSFLSNPNAEKILEAREAVLDLLREMSTKGDLTLDQF